MENQNASSAAENNIEAVSIKVENGSAQEVSSTTQPTEVTKRSLRVDTWKKIQANKCGLGVSSIFNRIPSFVDSDKAAGLLVETDEFRNAKHVKVNIDRALNAVKMQVLVAGKTLYLPVTRDSSALFLLVDCPPDATDEQRKEILHVQDVRKGRTEISLQNKIKLDMIVIGSVVVSRDGYRIGRGNGFTDLDIGLLIEIGSITPETTIVTVVHDLQVLDNLPIDLFQKYDTPVDLIVTPKEVIRVGKRLQRPDGIFWNILSERRLKIVPILQQLKEEQEKAGKVITLKEEDTDIERNNKGRGGQQRRQRRRPIRPRNNVRRAVSHTDTEHQDDEKPQTQKRAPRYYKRFGGGGGRRRRTTKSEGDHSQSAPEGKDRRQRKFYKKRPVRDFCVKITNIGRDIRIKDLKTELRKRECIPAYISWKGQYGKCYLHFATRSGTPSTAAEVEKVLNSLSELSLTVNTGDSAADTAGRGENGDVSVNASAAGDAAPQTKTYTLNVELMKFDEKSNNKLASDNNAIVDTGAPNVNRIESVDTTTV